MEARGTMKGTRQPKITAANITFTLEYLFFYMNDASDINLSRVLLYCPASQML